MNPPRRATALKAFDASWVPAWVEPLYVTVFRQKAGVQEQVPIPAGSGAAEGTPGGMGYSKTEVMALMSEGLSLNAGPGLYQFQLIDANNVHYVWHIQIGAAAPPTPPAPPPPTVPLGAGVRPAAWNAQPAWNTAQAPQPTWYQQWLQPQQPPVQVPNQGAFETLLAHVLADKEKPKKDNDPMGMIMMLLQTQGQAFEQRMSQWQQQVTMTLQQSSQQRQGGLDINKLLENLPVLIPLLLPLLRKDDSEARSQLGQLRMQMELERERREAAAQAQARIDAINAQIEQVRRDAANGAGNKNETLQFLQMLEQRHAHEMQMMAERQRSAEAKVPGMMEMLTILQTLKPTDSPLVEGFKELFQLAMANFGGNGERGVGEMLIDGVKELTGKIIDAKTAAVTAQAMANVNLSGPPAQQQQAPRTLQKHVGQDKNAQAGSPPAQGVPTLLATIQMIQQKAKDFVTSNGVSGLSAEEVAKHIDEIADELEKNGVPADGSAPILMLYRQGQAKIDAGEEPKEFWVILSKLLEGLPQEYQQEVFQALVELRTGGEDGDDSEQGGQDEESADDEG